MSSELVIFDRLAANGATPMLTLTLGFDHRQKGRLRARADDGREVALMLDRGRVLRGGTLLTGPDGLVLEIVAAPESVSEARADHPQDLTRAAYHLGNRHVPLQVGEGWLRYQEDHVLDEMVHGLGLSVTHLEAGFEPEPGAYAGGHQHAHD